ncbi:MAG: 23S rRNA (uracil(1939)-C(5))-methyltransferase RlmD [Firmicutes bacterium]|nr:23S rRNA (uracil(1939)-C(5))-methyltransferase RlmD [Bacillota bacterium]
MTVDIFDISTEGEGIGRIDGKIVFVPRALPGESVEIEITEDKGRFMKGVRTDIGHEPVCGGAPLIYYPYDKQLAWKEKHVKDCLERIGGFSDAPVKPIVGMDAPYHYRNKGEFKVDKGLPLCNVNCKDCPIQNPLAMEIANAFEFKNADELIVRTNEAGEHIAYSVQKNGYMLLQSEKKIINDYIGHLKIEVDPYSFYQVNTKQCVKLYDLVRENVDEGDSLLDLYCGAGTIGLYCADKASRTIGVEVVKEAVIQANRNAVINGIVNSTFICGKAEDVVKTKLQGVKADVVVLDPPRAGCKAPLLDTVLEINPKKIVYVSCNPATLARDLKILCAPGADGAAAYELVSATPVDMFPHTAHCETCGVLVKTSDREV